MIFWLILGCAIKDGVEIVKIQNEYKKHVADMPPSEMSFEQNMATLYIQKSWEEYSNSQYQDALVLAQKSKEWLEKSRAAQQKQTQIESTQPLQTESEDKGSMVPSVDEPDKAPASEEKTSEDEK